MATWIEEKDFTFKVLLLNDSNFIVFSTNRKIDIETDGEKINGKGYKRYKKEVEEAIRKGKEYFTELIVNNQEWL